MATDQGKTTRSFMSGRRHLRHRRSTTGRRRGRIQPHGSPKELEYLRGDSPIGGLQHRVHGGNFFCEVPPSTTLAAPSGHQLLSPETVAAAATTSEPSDHILGVYLDEIEKSIVLPVCLNPSAREFFPDRTRRLDKYLDAARNLLQHRDVEYGSQHGRARCLLETVMSSLAVEFCSVKIWRPDALEDHLRVPPVRPSYSGGSASSTSCASSSDRFTGTSGSNDTSFGADHAALGEDWTNRSENSFFAGIGYIDLKSLATLDEIAGVMIEGGYQHILQGAIHQRCDQLARQVEVLDIDSILGSHTKESRENLTSVWIFAMRAIIGVLTEMQRQLNVHDFVHFNALKADYFMAIPKVYVMKLLNSATSLCNHLGPPTDPSWNGSYAEIKHAPSKIVNVVMMFEAVTNAMPSILALFSGQTKESILAEAEGPSDELSAMLLNLSVELNNSLRSQRLSIAADDTGVHRVTRDVMHHLGFLVQHKNTVLHMMVKGYPDGFGQLVNQLISSLEFTLETSSRSLGLVGQQPLFLVNNLHFMLDRARNTDVGLVLGESWLSRRDHDLDRYMTSYVEASWTPVMSSLFERRTRASVILWPHHQLLDKFTSSLEVTCSAQKAWKVTDPLVRRKLREAISRKVVPLYRTHVEKYSEKKHKSVVCDIEQLGIKLLEMFEG